MSTGRKALFSAFAACVSAALGFAVLSVVESWLWSQHPDRNLPPDGVIGSERYTFGHAVKNNAYGFRERDFESPKPPGVYRIMVLGDSFTWGVGLAVEDRYTAVAEHLLNRASADTRFEVLNFGVFGLSTVVQRDLLLAYRTVVDPDLIVVGFCFNDPQPKGMDYSIEKHNLMRSMTGSAFNRITAFARDAGFPYLSRSMRRRLRTLAERAGLTPVWQDGLQRTYEPSSKEWRDFVRALSDIRRMSDALDLPPPVFSVLNHARTPSDFENPTGFAARVLAWERQAEKAARDLGFTAYNHGHEIRGMKDELLWVNADDLHPGAALNRVYGEKLHRTISDMLGMRH